MRQEKLKSNLSFLVMFREDSQIGPYTLIRKLGRGGFGEVWLAERRTKFVTTKVAVKLPLDEQIDHETIKQEATLWEQASGHPNILPIIDADEYDGQVVIVSEFAPDGSLDEWLKTHGKMPVEQAIETTIKILDGLEFLHSRHIIHRDLKPANILLQGNTPRLADFGISRALRTTASSQSSNVSGTFAYMSPEGFDGKRSVQTDIWSVGVNLYQFLTGELPFPQKEPSALIAAIMMREFEPLPDPISQSVKDIVVKSLAKLPENRYTVANKMREDLKRVFGKGSSSSSTPTEILPTVNAHAVKAGTHTVLPRIPDDQLSVATVAVPRPTYDATAPQGINKIFRYVPASIVGLLLISAIMVIFRNQGLENFSNKPTTMPSINSAIQTNYNSSGSNVKKDNMNSQLGNPDNGVKLSPTNGKKENSNVRRDPTPKPTTYVENQPKRSIQKTTGMCVPDSRHPGNWVRGQCIPCDNPNATSTPCR